MRRGDKSIITPHVMFLDLCAEYGIPVSQISGADLRKELTGVWTSPGV